MAIPPLVAPGPALTAPQKARYARHILLPQIGLEGQRRLVNARVLVVGAGGLGSPALLYLAAAGVGTIGVVDDDVVDASNLQRQVVHGVADVGRLKTESAAETVAGINPLVTVVRHDVRLTSANALEILADYDVVLDGADNFATRYLVNDACVLLGLPHVWGSIYRFDGQVSVWFAGVGPCYRCVFPDPPPPDAVPSCATGGVLGVLCAAIGSVQVAEAIKLITGQGDPLVGRLLVHDSLRQTWDSLTVRADPACRVCGESPTVTTLVDYDEFCGMPGASDAASATAGGVDVTGGTGFAEVTAVELASMLAARDRGEAEFELVDVREPGEREVVSIPGARAIHLEEFRSGAAAAALPRGIPVVLHCKSGVRSAEAAGLLAATGRQDVSNLAGGVLAWVRDVDPSLPTY
ncbi:molybdopterin-synthase adenylyltransferase MoeB [Nostocoides sp. HKS02]|uniref:molybdopterin-synthase adenylyltransferase MoeB n=1 Tax=Nostocoides sp. HKS02 TaxID=1813880 RepID=UPI0012B4621E|nr:molybdopterin-synthase adenylyltransferase MoeB [Tetrasphaera sp. HKS02]QGN58108.1 molybdopterin-synthase adenylyltransferase MoeB [Tetrasphaera sp. HKS02]